MGLSPRMRGNPADVAGRKNMLRSIPACTGEPIAMQSAIRPGWVYPRVYGGTQR